MINNFDAYLPSKWLEGGLVVASPRREPRPFKFSKRAGTLHLALSTVVLSCALNGFGMTVLAKPIGMGNIQAFELTSIHIDEDIVPAAYWQRLRAAAQIVVPLPDQSTQSDPPIAF